MATPPRPAVIDPWHAPAGVRLRFVDLSVLKPTQSLGKPFTTSDERAMSIFIHTNGASGQGSVDSAWRHIHADFGTNTCPHYQVDRTVDGVVRADKFLPTNVRGLANATVMPGTVAWSTLTDVQQHTILQHGQVRNWSLAVETADTGTNDDPAISAFDAGQLEMIATIVAYESMVGSFPLAMVGNYWDAGVASHTDPWGYPYTTVKRGKICPGLKKKAQVRGPLLDRARVIADAWLDVPPVSLPNSLYGGSSMDVLVLALESTGDYYVGNHIVRRKLSGKGEANSIIATGNFSGGRVSTYDLGSRKELANADDMVAVSAAAVASLGLLIN